MTRFNWDNFPPGATRTFHNCSRGSAISSFRKFCEVRGPDWRTAQIKTRTENPLQRKGWYGFVHCTRVVAGMDASTDIIKEHMVDPKMVPCHVRKRGFSHDKMELIKAYGKIHVLDLRLLPEDTIAYLWKTRNQNARVSRVRWEFMEIGESVAVTMSPSILSKLIPNTLIGKMMFLRFHIRRCSTPLSEAHGNGANKRWYMVTRVE
jgi:hypothetical protein